jgi:hypothetical protein
VDIPARRFISRRRFSSFRKGFVRPAGAVGAADAVFHEEDRGMVY